MSEQRTENWNRENEKKIGYPYFIANYIVVCGLMNIQHVDNVLNVNQIRQETNLLIDTNSIGIKDLQIKDELKERLIAQSKSKFLILDNNVYYFDKANQLVEENLEQVLNIISNKLQSINTVKGMVYSYMKVNYPDLSYVLSYNATSVKNGILDDSLEIEVFFKVYNAEILKYAIPQEKQLLDLVKSPVDVLTFNTSQKNQLIEILKHFSNQDDLINLIETNEELTKEQNNQLLKFISALLNFVKKKAIQNLTADLSDVISIKSNLNMEIPRDYYSVLLTQI
jgi:hypothetical protein